jgi:hypothetical protein
LLSSGGLFPRSAEQAGVMDDIKRLWRALFSLFLSHHHDGRMITIPDPVPHGNDSFASSLLPFAGESAMILNNIQHLHTKVDSLTKALSHPEHEAIYDLRKVCDELRTNDRLLISLYRIGFTSLLFRQ